jgi:predicted dithiol-disulfide oxidoreductase (DUF899 family)
MENASVRSVFSRRDGAIRHFYSGEMSSAMVDPGQDPRGAPDLDPLWLILDLAPEGRTKRATVEAGLRLLIQTRAHTSMSRLPGQSKMER